MNWVKDENNRKIVGFICAGIAAIIAGGWTLFKFFYDPINPEVKPHLKVYSQKYVDKKLIAIKNTGFGPAVITSSEFCRGNICTGNLVELFDLDVTWEFYANLTKGASIKNSEMHVLMKLVLNESQGKTSEALKEWQKQKTGIKVKINYEDMVGNKYGPLLTTLN